MYSMVTSASVPVKICMVVLLWMSVRSWATGIYLYRNLKQSLSSISSSGSKRYNTKLSDELMRCLHAHADDLNELGIIAKISPYVGLIGTVLGVMHTMGKLALETGINMAVVGPGISEALVTTALGLCVAIPASVMHDMCQQLLFQLEDVLMPEKGV